MRLGTVCKRSLDFCYQHEENHLPTCFGWVRKNLNFDFVLLQISSSMVQNWMTSVCRAREMPKLRNTSNFNSPDLMLTIGSLGLKNHWREHVKHSRGNNFPGKKENSHLRGTIWNYERLFLPKPTKYSFTLSTCSSPYTWWSFYCFSLYNFQALT